MVYLNKKRHYLTREELKSKVQLARHRKIERVGLLIDENHQHIITRTNFEDFIDEEIMSADLIIQPVDDATVWVVPIKRNNRYLLYLMHDLKRLCAHWMIETDEQIELMTFRQFLATFLNEHPDFNDLNINNPLLI